jgi:(1->4)-alpha-D-glucan 1-alpha-D-glucosylmutase
MAGVSPAGGGPARPGAWATYRVQLNSGFGFVDAAAISGYLAALGVTHLYCSPYLQAVPGSSHGYDVSDPTRFNEELGGAPGYSTLVGALRQAGLGQLLDIVPNHMAAGANDPWWWDVLENGPASLYAAVFDIDWTGSAEKSAFRVLVPVLRDQYGRVLEAGELELTRADGEMRVIYQDHCFPLSPRTFDEPLSGAARRAGSPELAVLAERFGSLPSARMTDPAAVRERHDVKIALTAELATLCERRPELAAALDGELKTISKDPDRFDQLLGRQNYRLAFWRVASEELDYRRFFNIETLVGVRVEDPAVFSETHRLILELVRDGSVGALRVDHVDGLRDPEGYLSMLSQATNGVYTAVEKILEPGESLPTTWPVAGTSGYDFLIRVNNLFVATRGEAGMSDCYIDFTGETASYDEVVYSAKQQIMTESLAAEVERVTNLLAEACDRARRHRDHTRRVLLDALREVVAHLDVYRTYVHPRRLPTNADRHRIGQAVSAAGEHRPDLDPELLRFIGSLALGEAGGEEAVEFAPRFQQLSAPVMAKGVEDTAFYRYHRLISLNEVGGDPSVFGRPVTAFHTDTRSMADAWPNTMLTLSTHDTKRSADVRGRLNVLSEIPHAWDRAVNRWASHNAGHREAGWPDANAEYLLYQTLVGAWPIDAPRAVAFMAKATKEAKVHTSWENPNTDYDRAVEGFTAAVLADRSFRADLEAFLSAEGIIERGRRNSLAQTTLLLTCPGVADIYQGSEVWDLSLVDPDNRRPVDYQLRSRLLKRLDGASPAEAAASAEEGGTKLWLIRRLLSHRRARPERYENAEYEPLALSGTRPDDALGFTRGGLAVVIPRLGRGGWTGTRVGLPAGVWRSVFGGGTFRGGWIGLEEVFGSFPIAVLERA